MAKKIMLILRNFKFLHFVVSLQVVNLTFFFGESLWKWILYGELLKSFCVNFERTWWGLLGGDGDGRFLRVTRCSNIHFPLPIFSISQHSQFSLIKLLKNFFIVWKNSFGKLLKFPIPISTPGALLSCTSCEVNRMKINFHFFFLLEKLHKKLHSNMD